MGPWVKVKFKVIHIAKAYISQRSWINFVLCRGGHKYTISMTSKANFKVKFWKFISITVELY